MKTKLKKFLKKLKLSDADFAQLAKDNSTDEKTKANGGEITFDLLQQKYQNK